MKTAFITGAGRGLGLGFVEALLDYGYRVFGGVRELSGGLPEVPNLTWVKCDVTSNADIAEVARRLHSEVRSLELLINNAGVNSKSATAGKKEKVCNLDLLDRSMLMSMFDVNAVSPLLVLEYLLPLLSSESAFVINISSCRASYNDEFKSSNANYGYRASKAALNMLTACAVVDLPENVKIFAVHPGSVRTDMNPGGDSEPKEQAGKILAITKNWKPEFNGKFLNFDGTFYPL